ncbi:MAG: neutral/alkaline non-lysosomal ceramidase N-terminal domain-containing protein [Chitinophagaceae bacterium]|nr:neutral/alkaline non-lysosomal ceramidase N-terminal domain-containing protein [Chitinophagaceae bacterium]
MKQAIIGISSFLLMILFVPGAEGQTGSSKNWKAGVARVVITPERPQWMAGYGSRDRVSEGKIVDIWAKALALQDESGKRSVLVTADLVGIPKKLSDHIRDQVKIKYNLSRPQIAINTSHTHTGPVLSDALVSIYPVNASQQKDIDEYTVQLGEKIIALVGKALRSMEPVKLYSGNGVTRFQVNRRNNVEATLTLQSDLNGPNDYAVPVIKVENRKGDLMAIMFGYACHNTVLAGYKWSGDWAGFAQIELEKDHPGATALFVQGCGADQNPLPRRTVQLAEQYGQELAAAVNRVLTEDMQPLSSNLSTAYSEVELPLNIPPTKEELSKEVQKSTGYEMRWAQNLIKQIDSGESLRTSYPYPVQVWKVGEQPIVILGGETVIDYSIALKHIFGPDLFVLGYSNDVMSYIPSARIVQEGGYEGASSQMVYGLPSTWKPDIETLIIEEVLKLAKQVGVPMATTKVS